MEGSTDTTGLIAVLIFVGFLSIPTVYGIGYNLRIWWRKHKAPPHIKVFHYILDECNARRGPSEKLQKRLDKLDWFDLLAVITRVEDCECGIDLQHIQHMMVVYKNYLYQEKHARIG